jgi:hypothetical protein
LSLIADVFRKEFNRHLMTYLKRTRNDLQKAIPENLDNFFWRNFSFYARKNGKNIHGLGTLSLMISIILTLIIIPTLGKDATTIMTMITVNQILG